MARRSNQPAHRHRHAQNCTPTPANCKHFPRGANIPAPQDGYFHKQKYYKNIPGLKSPPPTRLNQAPNSNNGANQACAPQTIAAKSAKPPSSIAQFFTATVSPGPSAKSPVTIASSTTTATFSGCRSNPVRCSIRKPPTTSKPSAAGPLAEPPTPSRTSTSSPYTSFPRTPSTSSPSKPCSDAPPSASPQPSAATAAVTPNTTRPSTSSNPQPGP